MELNAWSLQFIPINNFILPSYTMIYKKWGNNWFLHTLLFQNLASSRRQGAPCLAHHISLCTWNIVVTLYIARESTPKESHHLGVSQSVFLVSSPWCLSRSCALIILLSFERESWHVMSRPFLFPFQRGQLAFS